MLGAPLAPKLVELLKIFLDVLQFRLHDLESGAPDGITCRNDQEPLLAAAGLRATPQP